MENNEFSDKDIELLIKIVPFSTKKNEFKNAKKITASDLARSLNIARQSPRFVKLLRYLFNNNIITYGFSLGNSKAININYDELTTLIDNILEKHIFYEYLNTYHTVTW